LAQASAARGWTTSLLLGPATISIPPFPQNSQVRILRFQTTADLQRLLAEHWPNHDLLLMAAAVADFRPTFRSEPAAKIRRTSEPLVLELHPTPDLLGELVSITRSEQMVVGFALEPEASLLESAAQKLRSKRLHAIVANPLETLDAQTISATVIFRDGRKVAAPPHMSKLEFAEWLLENLLSNQVEPPPTIAP
jgi:phosphopantothenoylcysteine decarboxylase/phosphopantothenate--cysteine ligase